ncbi:MAG TPA: alanine-tRNA synthetase second additional domain-containing protein [Desulfobacteria bacterium]|nr:alanine-tRNA synthetase second additional domain-containing protein [Desulfobacteria bacterium]
MEASVHEYLMQAVYLAPRGRHRLLLLGHNLAQRYLSPDDNLIGFIGEAGSGKSLLIRGMFPGLELTNDDDGINVRPLPLLEDAEQAHFRTHTYHVDVRFEYAFTPLWALAEAVRKALQKKLRVVIEHFDLIYPLLKLNAQALIGVGEEVIVTRPSVYGPEPQEIVEIVSRSIKYRRMAHTAEDLTRIVLEGIGIKKPAAHADVKHGFVLEFTEKPDFDLDLVEQRVLDLIKQDLPICYHDDEHIRIGTDVCSCTGPRLHVDRTGKVTGFHLLKEFRWDPVRKLYNLAGVVGDSPNPLSLIANISKKPIKKGDMHEKS